MNENMVEKSVNSKKKYVLIILFIVILTLSGLVIYLANRDNEEENTIYQDNNNHKRKETIENNIENDNTKIEKEIDTKTEEEKTNTTIEEVKPPYIDEKTKEWANSKDYVVDIIKVYSYMSERKNGIDSFTYSELLKMFYFFAVMDKSYYTQISDYKDGYAQFSIETSSFDEFYKKIFGPDTKIDYNKFVGLEVGNEDYGFARAMINNKGNVNIGTDCGFKVKSYESETNKLIVSVPSGCGGAGYVGMSFDMKEKIIDKKETNNDMTLITQYVYKECVEGENPMCAYLSPVSKDGLIAKDDDNKEDTYFSKGVKCKMNFALNNDTNQYYFISSVNE